jgi:spore germination protein KA
VNRTNQPGQQLAAKPAENISFLKKRMRDTQDLICIEFTLCSGQPGAVCYLQGLTDERKLENLLKEAREKDPPQFTFRSDEEVESIDQVAEALVHGKAVVLLSDPARGIAVNTLGVQLRKVDEPTSESTLKGPRSGFTESLSNNLALVRFYLPSADLKAEYCEIGQTSPIKVALISIDGVTNPVILEEVRRRIREIPADFILGSNYIEEWIVDNPYTLFPLVESTERPDRVVGALIDGRIAVMVQGSPFVTLLPFVFLQAFQVGEDYEWQFYIGSALRILRIFCALVGMLLPAFYVATITFHHELIPTALLQSIAAAKEPVPFPAVVESFAMMAAFEIMREAGIRMPRQVGQAVSIVGALILGQAAVQAGIVSPIMVIVAALTGICTFTLPATAMNYAIRLLQFGMTFLGSILGYVGMMFGIVILLTYLASLRSFGIPYLAPAAPFQLGELTDIVVRRPHPLNVKRPALFRSISPYRWKRSRP